MDWKKKFPLWVYLLLALGLITYGKLSLIPFESSDYYLFLDPWCSTIVKNGYMKAFREKFANYSPLYLYYLVLVSKLFHSSLWLIPIKALSIAFDFVVAYFGYKIIFHFTQFPKWSLLGGLLLFALPTLAMNSAAWGQCDSIYGAFVLGAFYFFLKKRAIQAFIFLGIALSFKIQTVFIFPILALLYFSDYGLKIWHFFLIPLVFFLSVVPAWIAGGDLGQLLLTYIDQTDQYHQLTLGAPSAYSFFPNVYSTFKTMAIAFAAVVVAFVLYVYFSFHTPKKEMDILSFSFLFTCLVPFFLPAMHERYFFLADVFSVLYCFCKIGKFYFALCLQLISCFSYLPVLFQYKPFEIHYVALFFCFILYLLAKEIFAPSLENIKQSSSVL